MGIEINYRLYLQVEIIVHHGHAPCSIYGNKHHEEAFKVVIESGGGRERSLEKI